MNINEVKRLLKKHGVFPQKRLGQNFLINEKYQQKIINTASLIKQDLVVEIGPGIGNLTRRLAQIAKKVIAIEKDKRMEKTLRETLRVWGIRNVQFVNKDVLKIREEKINKWGSYKLVANLPYYITSPVIRKFLESKNSPSLMVLTIQREVAERICSSPPKMSILSVSVQFFSTPEIICFVPRSSFWPQPKVDSAILKINPYPKEQRGLIEVPLFFNVVRAGFSHPRKQLINNLSRGLEKKREEVKEWLVKNNIQPQQRAETLRLEDWKKMVKSFKMNQ